MISCLQVFVLLILHIEPGYTLRCLECTDMPHPWDCGLTTDCSPHQQCFLNQKVTDSGHVVYDSGCVSNHQCDIIGKRHLVDNNNGGKPLPGDRDRREDIVTCAQCCNDKNFCNIDGCGQTALSQPTRGPYCFKCTLQAGEKTCREAVLCDKYESCYLMNATYQDEHLLTSACSSQRQCDQIHALYHHTPTPVGKRDDQIDTILETSFGIHENIADEFRLKIAETLTLEQKTKLGKLTDGTFDISKLKINGITDMIHNSISHKNSDEIDDSDNTNNLDRSSNSDILGNSDNINLFDYVNRRSLQIFDRELVDRCPFCCATDFCNDNCFHTV